MTVEQMTIIPGFPDYLVTDHGRVLDSKHREMTRSPNEWGVLTVGLTKHGKQHRRSIKKLVAESFVSGQTEIFDTPILLDNDQENLFAGNMLWRPRWFAIEYSVQFHLEEPWWNAGPLVDDHDNQYETIYDFVQATGSLFRDVRTGLMNTTPIFPHGFVLEFI